MTFRPAQRCYIMGPVSRERKRHRVANSVILTPGSIAFHHDSDRHVVYRNPPSSTWTLVPSPPPNAIDYPYPSSKFIVRQSSHAPWQQKRRRDNNKCQKSNEIPSSWLFFITAIYYHHLYHSSRKGEEGRGEGGGVQLVVDEFSWMDVERCFVVR